ncbi:fibronectin type III domain-containing protein 7 [Betta splendens]|uniref:Fibronectin type III domain-containing protein 7 n=1 Tax=Betta splendens TaxID=158456 RepID=A0A9W2XCD4_BETSP|nr:fibronectin type III domain-containing protein 7 [Betta splendens]
MTVQWSGLSGAGSYRITATPKYSSVNPVFAQFAGNTVMGSLNSLSPNTVYTVQLEAIDNAFNVLSSAKTEETTAPDIPSITQAYSKQSDSITVEFTAVSGATSYILRAETDDFFSETPVSGSPGTVLDLQPYTDYQLSVMSVNAGGRSQPSEVVGAKTVVPGPRINTTSPSNDSILVTWLPVENAVLYTLCIIMEGSSTRHKLNTTDTAVTFGDLQAGATYCIKGAAWDAEGRTGDDLTVCQITRPSSPNLIDVQVTPGRSLGIVVYWVSVQGAENYVASTSGGQNCTSVDNAYCYIMPVECGNNRTVSVTAVNAAGPSSPSQPAPYITYPCLPGNIWVEEPTPGNCSLRWDDVQLVEYYMAFIKRDDGTERSCNTTRTTCDFFCACGYTYLVTVFPYNQAGSSPYANVQNYTTIPCCPQGVATQLVSTDTLEVTWLPVKGAELYETRAARGAEVVRCSDTSPACVLSDLRCDAVYSVTVTPCSELRGCNLTCPSGASETAPCAPEILNMTQTNSSAYRVFITRPNAANATYTVTAVGRYDAQICQTVSSWCDFAQLPCGSSYEVTTVATTAAGRSLPGYSQTLETGPCCPASVNVTQVTQAMTNVTWAPGSGARSYVTSLLSSRGYAKCHTLDTHCLMGCITCSTNYSVALEAISSTGHKSQCNYQGFSSSPCCPTGIKLYRGANNTVRVYWRPLGPQISSYVVDLYGSGVNYTCTATGGMKYCDIQEDTARDVYTAVVAPVGQNGVKVTFCLPRTFSVPYPGTNANSAILISRRRRSVD